MKEIIRTKKAPEAIAFYSQAIKVGNLIYTSGQIAIDPETNELTGKNITEQTKVVMKNIIAILESANTDLKNAIKITVYLSDMNNYSEFNKIYQEFIKENPPARVVVESPHLPKGALIEIDCIALVP